MQYKVPVLCHNPKDSILRSIFYICLYSQNSHLLGALCKYSMNDARRDNISGIIISANQRTDNENRFIYVSSMINTCQINSFPSFLSLYVFIQHYKNHKLLAKRHLWCKNLHSNILFCSQEIFLFRTFLSSFFFFFNVPYYLGVACVVSITKTCYFEKVQFFLPVFVLDFSLLRLCYL